jgi:hypothetical protein
MHKCIYAIIKYAFLKYYLVVEPVQPKQGDFMKLVMFMFFGLMVFSASASEGKSQMVIEEVLSESGISTTVMSCTCYGDGHPYACQPVPKTCYGGPGNYPYTCYVCPQ